MLDALLAATWFSALFYLPVLVLVQLAKFLYHLFERKTGRVFASRILAAALVSFPLIFLLICKPPFPSIPEPHSLPDYMFAFLKSAFLSFLLAPLVVLFSLGGEYLKEKISFPGSELLAVFIMLEIFILWTLLMPWVPISIVGMLYGA